MAISFNDNIKISAPKPIDAKYLNSSNLPYANVAEVNSTILEAERYLGLTVNINNVEYWYKDGVGDGDLILKSSSSDGVVSGATFSGTTLVLSRTQNLPDVTVNISGITGIDTFVTGGTLSGTILSLQRTQDLPDVNIELSGLTTLDTYVTGGTYTTGNTLVLNRNQGLPDIEIPIGISGVTDGVVSGATLNGTDLVLSRTIGLGDVVADLSSLKADKYTGSTPSTVTVGGLSAGAILTGRTITDILQEMLVVYQAPAFTAAPTVTPQALTVEVGTTLSGSRTFTWSTTNSGNIQPNSIDIYDVTDASYLATGLTNDGSESVTITTIQLNANGDTQVWRMEGTNTNAVGFNSANRTVTSRFLRFYGATATSPTNSAQVRALPDDAFQTANSNTFTLNTGFSLTKFVVALPPSRTISNVIDLDALSADITSQYVLTGTINVLDAGGTNRLYNIYEMNIGAPYASNHRHEITTA